MMVDDGLDVALDLEHGVGAELSFWSWSMVWGQGCLSVG